MPSMEKVDRLVSEKMISDVLPQHIKVVKAKNPDEAQVTADLLAKQFCESNIGAQVVEMLQGGGAYGMDQRPLSKK